MKHYGDLASMNVCYVHAERFLGWICRVVEACTILMHLILFTATLPGPMISGTGCTNNHQCAFTWWVQIRYMMPNYSTNSLPALVRPHSVNAFLHGGCWRRRYCPTKTLCILTPSSWWPSSVRNWTMARVTEDAIQLRGTGFQPATGCRHPGLNANYKPFSSPASHSLAWPLPGNFFLSIQCTTWIAVASDGQLWVCTRTHETTGPNQLNKQKHKSKGKIVYKKLAFKWNSSHWW